MKNLLFFVLPALMMIGCGKKTQSTSATADSTKVADTTAQKKQAKDPTQDITNVVNSLYSDVSQQNSDGNEVYEDDDLVEKYGSADLKKSWKAYNKAIPDGMEGDIDCEIFTESQDMSNFSFNVKSVNMQGDNAANVVVSMTNCGVKKNVTLCMVNENGNWVVDDIIVPDSGDLKKIMKENS